MELVNQLMVDLNVTEAQARGGAGLLFKQARERLGREKYARIAAVLPDTDGLIWEVPMAKASRGDDLGKLYSLLGREENTTSHVVAGFLKLDMSSSMVKKFIPIILAYAKDKGGDAVKALLEEAF